MLLVARRERKARARSTPPTRSTSPAMTTRGCRAPAPSSTRWSRALRSVGIDVYQIDHEDANGQFEVNFTYADALKSADNFTFVKMAASEIARKHGMIATFMPKPFSNRTGSGAHFHISIGNDKHEESVRRRSRQARPGAVDAGLSISRRRAGARARAGGGVRADRQFVQAPGRRPRAVGRHLGAGLHRLRRQQSHGLRAHSRWTARIAVARFGLQSVSRHCGRGRRRPRRHRAQARSGRADQHQHVRAVSEQQLAREEAYACCRRTCSRPSASWKSDEVVKAGLGAELSNEFIKLKRMEWTEYARHVSDWETKRYLEFF